MPSGAVYAGSELTSECLSGAPTLFILQPGAGNLNSIAFLKASQHSVAVYLESSSTE